LDKFAGSRRIDNSGCSTSCSSKSLRQQSVYGMFACCCIGRCRSDWEKDHCWHVWWLGCTWWWCILRQGLLKGWSICSLCSTLGGKVAGACWAVPTCPSPGRCPCLSPV